MNINIDPVIASRIREAWNKLPADKQALLAPAILRANQQAVYVSQTKKAPPGPAAPHHLMLAHSAITNDSDAVQANLEAAAVVTVDPDGVIWGTGKYQQLDPGWAEAFAVFLETFFTGTHNFIANPATITIPDKAQIGLVGDWGTGSLDVSGNPSPSTDVGNHLKLLQTDLTIHLGDVYYSGTGDQEKHNLVLRWPRGVQGALALNSNHEMYSGAKPYFDAIQGAPFGMQNGCSYFVVENSNWVIVGLDSAYFSAWEQLYMNGSLGPAGGTQVIFLQQQVAKGKKVIVLTHHNGLTDDGSANNGLWDEVMSAFAPNAGPEYWYYGHEHVGAVYTPFGANVLCRCCGHGALPWGEASALANNPRVVWHEINKPSPNDIRVFNGFAVLRLDGPNIQETFYDENGGVTWQS